MTLLEAATLARIHANNVQADIRNAGTRIEHIRLSTLAIEAGVIASGLEELALAQRTPDVNSQPQAIH